MSSGPSKTIIITGVTRGLGSALSKRFIEKGHKIWGCGRSSTEIIKLRIKWGEPHQFESVDVAKSEQVQEWLDPLLKKHNAPDLLVNNAEVINGNAPL